MPASRAPSIQDPANWVTRSGDAAKAFGAHFADPADGVAQGAGAQLGDAKPADLDCGRELDLSEKAVKAFDRLRQSPVGTARVAHGREAGEQRVHCIVQTAHLHELARHLERVPVVIGAELTLQVHVHVHQAGQHEFVTQVDGRRALGLDVAFLHPGYPVALHDDRHLPRRRFAGHREQLADVNERDLGGGGTGQQGENSGQGEAQRVLHRGYSLFNSLRSNRRALRCRSH